jgi:N-acetylneuraminate lyase
MSLTVAERMAVTEAWVKTGLQVCVHVGTQSLLDTQRLARHAQDCGAHGIAVMCPMTIAKPLAIDNVVEYLEAVYRAAPRIPMLVYHFPTLTNAPFKLYDVLVACTAHGGRVPSVCGAKFTSWDLADYAACQSLGGPITDLLYSIEGNLVGAAFLGARAFVGLRWQL